MDNQNKNEIYYLCDAAENLDRCGRIIEVIAVIFAAVTALLWIVAFVQVINIGDGLLSFVFSLTSLGYAVRVILIALGGYMIKCIICGFAVIVDSHFRRSLDHELENRNESTEPSKPSNLNSILGPWTR